jgi:formate dehydrogenase subunit delta
MKAERLVAMANDIAAFFAAEPDRAAAVGGVLSHLTRFWEPRMRREIAAYYKSGGAGLSEIAAAAVAQLEDSSATGERPASRPRG